MKDEFFEEAMREVNEIAPEGAPKKESRSILDRIMPFCYAATPVVIIVMIVGLLGLAGIESVKSRDELVASVGSYCARFREATWPNPTTFLDSASADNVFIQCWEAKTNVHLNHAREFLLVPVSPPGIYNPVP